MAFDLLNIEPHKVSKDLSGYITYIYGAPKTGKTTLATQMGDSLLIALERGYNALPGVRAVDVTTWSEMKQVYRELKKPEVKAMYKAIIIDTVDQAADLCTKYVCAQKGIESLGDLGYGKGWTAFKEEFNDMFKSLTQLGYAVFFIGHQKEEKVSVPGPNGESIEKVHIRPALTNSTRMVIEGMADIIGYTHQPGSKEKMSIMTLRSFDDSIICGSRFKYMPAEIPTSYENLVKAVSEAIEKEAKENNGEFLTEERMKDLSVKKDYDYDGMMSDIMNMITKLMETDESNSLKITSIIESYLGKNRKVSDCTPEQCEQLELIQIDLKDLLNR